MARDHSASSAAALVALLSLSAAAQSPFDAREPASNRSTRETIELGRFLFESKALGEDGSTSCATCHDPLRSFADGLRNARGRLNVGIGRNSPTLFAIGLIEKFRDPGQAHTARPGRRPRVLSLEDRCLEPLQNPLEMGHSVESAVAGLKKDKAMDRLFDRAFGQPGEGVTRDRLAKSLAAFVRGVAPPPTPYREYLEGDQAALSEAELGGLLIFDGRGRCNQCHTGPALSDGLMHVVDPPDGQRMLDREREASERRIELLRRKIMAEDPERLARLSAPDLEKEAREMTASLPGGGGYDPSQVEVQTPTLWDVARTAPYFRDGSIKDLRTAVQTHVTELCEVAARGDSIRRAIAEVDKAGKRSPKSLRPPWDSRRRPAPESLSREDIDHLVAFLEACSPRPTSTAARKVGR